MMPDKIKIISEIVPSFDFLPSDFILPPLHWVMFLPAGPNLYARELLSENLGQTIHGKPLTRKMARQQEAHADRLGFQACMESGLANYHGIATVLFCLVEEFASRAACNHHGPNRSTRIAYQLQSLNR